MPGLDEAWASIKDKYYFPQEVDGARLALANAMLAIAWRYGQDVDALKNAALQLMARSHEPRSDADQPN